MNRQLELAQRYLLEEDYEQAIAAFEVIIDIDPKNVDAYLGLAEAYAAADELENAVKVLEKASKKVDSEEVLAQLEIHTAEIEQREQAAQRAAEAAQAAAEAATTFSEETVTASQQESAAVETPEPESETVLRGFIVRDNDWYYYDEIGNLVTGWFETNGNRYCARTDGILYRDGEHEIDSTKYQFDQLGVCLGEVKEEKRLLKKRECYNADGNLIYYYVYSYDSQGNLIREEECQYDKTQSGTLLEVLVGYYVYSYGSQGNIIKDEYYYRGEDDAWDEEALEDKDWQFGLWYYHIYSYDSQGNMVRKDEYGAWDDEIINHEINSYDNQGNITRRNFYYTEGILSGYTIYSYNNQGNMTKMEEHSGESGTLWNYTTYSYDEQGNITRENDYNADGSLMQYYVYSY